MGGVIKLNKEDGLGQCTDRQGLNELREITVNTSCCHFCMGFPWGRRESEGSEQENNSRNTSQRRWVRMTCANYGCECFISSVKEKEQEKEEESYMILCPVRGGKKVDSPLAHALEYSSRWKQIRWARARIQTPCLHALPSQLRHFTHSVPL